jgi:hypothetical protein
MRNPSLTLFEVALFKAGADQRRENTGDYHDPTRERGIFPNTASNAKAQSLADAAGWDSRKRATSKLTLRVVMKSTTHWRSVRPKEQDLPQKQGPSA